jgi:hypothetical protein
VKAVEAAFISDERERQQDKHHDQDDTLFVFRKLKNPEQGFHFA